MNPVPLLPVAMGRDAKTGPKCPNKIVDISKAGPIGDLSDLQLRGLQQLLRIGKAIAEDILLGCAADHLLEDMGQIGVVDIKTLCQGGNFEVLGEMRLNILLDLADPVAASLICVGKILRTGTVDQNQQLLE